MTAIRILNKIYMIIPQILIIPDIHGRDFHKSAVKEAVKNSLDIVCLGDYLDPYPYEESHEGGASKSLKELVALKKKYPHKIHLLIGNHDSSYMFHPSMCRARYDMLNGPRYHKYFQNNAKAFNLFYRTEIAGKNFIFSHAGITRQWMSVVSKKIGLQTDDFEAFLNELNERFKEFSVSNEKNLIWSLLSHIGVERGGQDDSGSIIWADFFEHADKKNWIDNDSITQIVGHTQLNYHPVSICNRLYCLIPKNSLIWNLYILT